VLTKILGPTLPYAAEHCHAGGTTAILPTSQGDNVESCHVKVAVHPVDDLSLQSETEMTGYFWFVCNTFSLGTFRTKVAFCGKHSHCPATIMRTAAPTFVDPEESIRFILNTVPSPFRIYATFRALYDEFILQTSSNHSCVHISFQISSNGSREAINVSVMILRMSDKHSVETPGLRKTFLTRHCQHNQMNSDEMVGASSTHERAEKYELNFSSGNLE
jgi:hypothetical protein